MKKIFVVTGFLSYSFVFGQTEESVRRYFEKDKYLNEYVTRMYEMDGDNKSAIEKLYNENITTLKYEKLNESFCNATKLAKFYAERCVFRGEGIDKLNDVDKLITKKLKNKDIYKTNSLAKLNGLMYLACFNNSCFSKSEKGEYQLSEEKVKRIIEKKLKEAANDTNTANEVKHCSNEIKKNSKFSAFLEEANAIDTNQSIDKDIRDLAILIINDVVWYLKNFKAVTLYNKLEKEIEDQFHITPLQNINDKTCYFNAAMQALYASKRFKNFIKDETNKLEELQRKIKAYQEAPDEHKKEKKELKQKVKESENKYKELQNRIKEHENTIKALKDESKQTKEEVNSNVRNYNNILNKINSLTNECNDLTKEIEEFDKWFNVMQQQQLDKHPIKLLQTVWGKSKDYKEMATKIISSQKKIIDLTNKKIELERKNEEDREKDQNLQNKIKEHENTAKDLKNKSGQTAETIDFDVKRYNVLCSNINILTGECNSLTKKAEEFDKWFNVMQQKQLDKHILEPLRIVWVKSKDFKKMATEIISNQTKIIDYTNLTTELKQKDKEYREKHQKLQEEIKKYEDTIKGLENELKEQENNNKIHQEELKELTEMEKDYKEHIKRQKDDYLLKALNDLFYTMQYSTCNLDKDSIDKYIQRIFKCLPNTDFNKQVRSSEKATINYEQSDATELIRYILDTLEEERFFAETECIFNMTVFSKHTKTSYSSINRNNYIWLYDYNQEKLKNLYKQNGGKLTMNNFIDLCLEQEDSLDSINSLPEVLCVINSFTNINVSYQPELVLKEGDGTKVKYKLVSVITKSGDYSNGHYYTYARGRKGKWFNINDEKQYDITNQVFNEEFDTKKRNGEPYKDKRYLAFIYEKVSE